MRCERSGSPLAKRAIHFQQAYQAVYRHGAGFLLALESIVYVLFMKASPHLSEQPMTAMRLGWRIPRCASRTLISAASRRSSKSCCQLSSATRHQTLLLSCPHHLAASPSGGRPSASEPCLAWSSDSCWAFHVALQTIYSFGLRMLFGLRVRPGPRERTKSMPNC